MTYDEAHEVQKAMRKAIRSGNDIEFLRLLSTHSSQLDAKGVFGTWLHFAASHGRLEIVKELVAMGCPIDGRSGVHDSSPLHLAASDGQFEVVKYLLECGAMLDVSAPERNPLFGAIYGGHTAIAKLLIDKGIDTAVTYSSENMTKMDAIGFANKWGRSDVITLLNGGLGTRKVGHDG